jgi:hypothetical protein
MDVKKIGILMIGLLLLMTMAFAMPSDANLVSWFKLDETTGTYVLNSKNPTSSGTLFGSNYLLGTPGIIKNNFSFFGDTNTFVDTNTTGIQNVSYRGAVAAWVKTTNATAVNDGIVVSRLSTSGVGIFAQSSSLMYCSWNNATQDYTIDGNIKNGWHFIVCTQDAVTRKGYVDGQQVSTGVAVEWHVTNNFMIGIDLVNTTKIFDGNIDEVSIWYDGLTSADVNALYNAGMGVTYCGSNVFASDCNAPFSFTPFTTSTANANWNTNTTVTFTCDTNTGANCQDLNYSINDGVWNDVNFTANAYTITVSDGNNKLQFKSRNVTGLTEVLKTAYQATDTNVPIVGVTTINGFSLYSVGGNWIKGSGNVIGGTATDSLSDINTLSCQIRLNAGDAFTTKGTWNTNHCEYGVFGPVNNNISYVFNTRVKDKAGNLGTGTQTIAYLGDSVGPITTDNSVANYTANTTITLTSSDGNGSGVKATWYCIDQTNTCTPNISGTSYTTTVANGFVNTFYMRYISMDKLDNNGGIGYTSLITVNRTSQTTYPDNNTNQSNWMTITNNLTGSLFGYDYTSFAILCLALLAGVVFLFRINSLVAIILSIPLTYGFLVLAGGNVYILSAILVLEIIALAVRIGISLLDLGNRGA